MGRRADEPLFVPLPDYREYPVDEMAKRAREFLLDLARRRTVRDFSSRPVPRAIIEGLPQGRGHRAPAVRTCSRGTS